MTEGELYRALALPLILAVTVLAFSKVSWPRRFVSAVAVLMAGAIVGFGHIWFLRSGAPGWTGWAALAVVLALFAAWMWTRRRSTTAP